MDTTSINTSNNSSGDDAPQTRIDVPKGLRLIVSTNVTLHRIPDSTDWETWERKRAFLVCKHCHHWVRRIFTACGCTCHRPSNAQAEARIDVRHFSGTTKGKYQRSRDVA